VSIPPDLREHPALAPLRNRLASHQPSEAEKLEARRAAVALILRLGESDEPEIFFIQRAEYAGDPWSGQVAFPGGREEEGDRTLVDTAVRETLEETSLDLAELGEVIGQLDDLRPMTVRLPAVVVRPYVFVIGRHPEPALSSEVADSFWVPVRTLRDDSGWRDTVVTARGLEFTRRAFHHSGFVVWGMTERILSGVLALTS
jgi:8-oxo-dGTP pyrophosphatase MutT (NUDIX family)